MVFTSCGDPHDRLMDEQVEWMGEIAAVFDDLADGKLTSEEAVQKMDELQVKKDAFALRRDDLGKELTQAQAEKLIKKHSLKISEALGDVMHAKQRAVKSGKMTRELQDALREKELL